MTRWRTVALLGREAGLSTLEHCLGRSSRLDLVAVATHRRLPRSESPTREERPEWPRYRELCAALGVPLVAIDRRGDGRDPELLREHGPVDLLVSVSWRYVLTASALGALRVGGVNLHRGALPGYAGAEPVRRMLEDGHGWAEITAHQMVEEVDAGAVLATVRTPMRGVDGGAVAARVADTKAALVPLYPALLDLALEALARAP